MLLGPLAWSWGGAFLDAPFLAAGADLDAPQRTAALPGRANADHAPRAAAPFLAPTLSPSAEVTATRSPVRPSVSEHRTADPTAPAFEEARALQQVARQAPATAARVGPALSVEVQLAAAVHPQGRPAAGAAAQSAAPLLQALAGPALRQVTPTVTEGPEVQTWDPEILSFTRTCEVEAGDGAGPARADLFSTFQEAFPGGGDFDQNDDVAVDVFGNVYTIGTAFDPSTQNTWAFVTRVSPNFPYTCEVHAWTGAPAGFSYYGTGIAIEPDGSALFMLGVAVPHNLTQPTRAFLEWVQLPGWAHLHCVQIHVEGFSTTGYDVTVANDPNYIFVTGSIANAAQGTDVYVIRMFLDRSGGPCPDSPEDPLWCLREQWRRTFDFGGLPSVGYNIDGDVDENAYVTGTYSNGADTWGFVLRVNNGGTRGWSVAYNSPAGPGDNNVGRGLDVGPDGFIYMTGTMYSLNQGDHNDMVLGKFHATTGAAVWFRRWVRTNPLNNVGGYGIRVDTAGNSYVVGSLDFNAPPAYNINVYVVKIDPLGATILNERALGNGNPAATTTDRGTGIALPTTAPNVDVIVTGWTESPDFIPIAAPCQPTFGGLRDAFITRFSQPI